MSSENTKPQRQNILKRSIAVVLLGAFLFVVGYGIYHSGLIGSAYRKVGGQLTTAPTQAPYTREQMQADRKAYSKSASAKPPEMPVGADGYYIPPKVDEIPVSPYGDAVRRGRDIFTNTGVNAKDHVGNELACSNCHLDAGRRENSAPMWGAYVSYPAFRKKTGAISTLEDRIMGCFMYSMNAQNSPSGHAPPAGSDIYRDLMTYMAWLADGVPSGNAPRGALYPKLAKPAQSYDIKRGQEVYQQNCALCHGDNGQGTKGTSVTGEKMQFPPLWGEHSYNWGAGIARIDTAAGFIYANMPFGKPYSLTEQQAWDVAAFVNSQERPKDPRQTGTLAEATEKYHAGEQSYYGKTVDGKLIGVGTNVHTKP